MKNFKPLAVKPILLSLRPDGTFRTMDGQQEVLACQELGHKKVMARIVRVRSEKEESGLFYYGNAVAGLSCGTKFRAALLAGEEAEVKINGIVERWGFSIAMGRGRPSLDRPVIKAVGVLKYLYNLGEDYLSDTLEILTRAFRLKDNSGRDVGIDVSAHKEGQFIKAVGNLLANNYPRLTTSRAIKCLKGLNVTALCNEACGMSRGKRFGRNCVHNIIYNSLARRCRLAA